ncbi:MAG: type III restriction-modification system endonuclease [Prevotella sp.]|nr:type III restriction-modification system endonuclease [Prevotella sp.]
MELKLESSLAHQLAPVNAVATVVEASIKEQAKASHQNPVLTKKLNAVALEQVRREVGIYDKATKKRIHEQNLPEKIQALPAHSILDIKMETGTGKTYVYTRTIFELHKRCGFNKFIIAVPTLPIKAGTASFIDDAEVMRHFSNVCGYNAEIELCLLEPQKQKKKGRQNIPSAVGHFFYGSRHVKNKIYVLLLNTQLLTSGKLLTRDDYDQTLGEFHKPVDAIKDTLPVLIIDEPHRMDRGSKSYEALIENFCPQLVIRYGATFPEFTFGRGKNKIVVKDYQELLYDLNAATSFNNGLIKGVAKEHLDLPGGRKAEKKVRIVSTDSGSSVNLKYSDANNVNGTIYTLHIGESLGGIDPDLDGVVIEGITKSSILLSNGQEKFKGDEFYPDQYGISYLESMIELALMRHFETERQNFCREGLPIKTLTLFFIDNIESFRGPSGKNDGWLRQKFMDLLKNRVNQETLLSNTKEYEDYLKATLANIENTCAGYFSQDNNDTDENIANEVKTILHGKKDLLSFTDKEGRPNVLRFLFSKWTLKEGWDNPNVFTICKLRSSGSEISKLQEVGRGLRLPVDSAGNRICDNAFMLNYIVDFTEKDFANKLVAEINGELESTQKRPLEITYEDMVSVAQKRGVNETSFFIELLQKEYVNINKQIVPDKFDDLLKDYPEFNSLGSGVNTNRIINRNSARTDTIHIRKAKFDELKGLWKQLNRKYILYFDKEIDHKLERDLPGIIETKHVFSLQVVDSKREEMGIEGGAAYLKEGSHASLTLHGRHYAYNEFLTRSSRHTNIPIQILHSAICQAVVNGFHITNEMFNEDSMARLIAAVDDWKCNELLSYVRYKQANYEAKETKLTNADGSVKKEVVQAYIGNKIVPGTPPEKYLYDAYAHDSGLELENIKTQISEVVVYGKIPSHSICIPTVASSNYSPDFMYVVKNTDGSKELNIVIETKAYDKESHISSDEDTKISCAEEFFKTMTANGYTVHFRKQINSTGIKAIIDSLMDK